MASSDLQWQVLRKYSRYLTRNAVGDRRYFSTVRKWQRSEEGVKRRCPPWRGRDT